MQPPPSAPATCVVDASLAIRAVLPVSTGTATIQLFVDWRRSGARVVAPMLWLAECVSVIRGAVFANVISAEEGRHAIEDVLALEVETLPTDASQCHSAFDWAGRLRQARAYDGFYLAIAEGLGASLWTADRRLANSARQLGVDWVHAIN